MNSLIFKSIQLFLTYLEHSSKGEWFSVPAAVDDGAKSTAIVEPQAESFANAPAPDLVANQDASDLNKEATTYAPLESHGEAGASIQLFLSYHLCLHELRFKGK